MATTLKLDDDVADALKEQSRRRNVPLEKMANDILRRHVEPVTSETGNPGRFRVKPFDGGFAKEFEGMTPKEVLNKLDDEYYAKKLAQ